MFVLKNFSIDFSSTTLVHKEVDLNVSQAIDNQMTPITKLT